MVCGRIVSHLQRFLEVRGLRLGIPILFCFFFFYKGKKGREIMGSHRVRGNGEEEEKA